MDVLPFGREVLFTRLSLQGARLPNRESQENRSTRGGLVRTNQAPTNPNNKEVLATGHYPDS